MQGEQVRYFLKSFNRDPQRSLPESVIENADDIIGRLRRGARCG